MKRKNLLITTIGKLDCIPTWISEDRNFDIAFIFYPDKIDAETKKKLKSVSDYLFFKTGFKYTVIKKIFAENPQLLTYDYYWMPDDDVNLVKGTVNDLFDLAKIHFIGLGQPSTFKSNTSWKFLRHKRGYAVRYSNFVEVMCPLFSQKSLTNCLDSFSYTKSGWGLDFLWSSLVTEKIGILDQVIIKHTKEINLDGGALYKKLLKETGKTPREELDELIKAHNLVVEPRIIDRLYAKSLLGKIRFYIDKLS